MIRLSRQFFSNNLQAEGNNLIARMALGYDPEHTPKYVIAFREGGNFYEKGQIRHAKEKFLEALECSECVDKYHRAAICGKIRKIDKKEQSNNTFYKVLGIFSTICAGVSVCGKSFIRPGSNPIKPVSPPLA